MNYAEERRGTNWPKLARDWVGLRVKFKKARGNSLGELPEGTTATVVDWWQGCSVRTDPCEHCGMSLHITRIYPGDLQIIDQPEGLPITGG